MPDDSLPTLAEGQKHPLDDSLSDMPPFTQLATQADTPSLPPTPQVQVPGYEILGELGRGGMGVVYKARQTGLNRLVALKMILSGSHASAADLQRFRTEAEAIARLRHPNIIQVYDIGEHEGRPYFSLELCSGGGLDRMLRARPLEPREAARLVEQLARGMQHAHEAGVIHRDLKPANILLQSEIHGGEGGPVLGAETLKGTLTLHTTITPKITDFGLAKKLDEAGQTASGAVMGTPSYMAPEQACGDTRLIGPLSDVYSLGAILYQCLTGRPPFYAATAVETLVQVLHGEAVPPRTLQPSVPRDLETVCLKCLQRSPLRRYESAAALADDLRRFLDGEPIQARAAGLGERVLKWARRRPTTAAMLALSVLSLLGAALGVLLFMDRLQSERDNALAAEARADKARAVAEQEKEKALQAQRQRALAQVNALLDATPQEVPTLQEAIAPFRADVEPRLREVLAEPAPPETETAALARWRHRRARAALSLLDTDASSLPFLSERLLSPELAPEETLLLRKALLPHAAELAPALWERVDKGELASESRFRALIALAALDADSPRWQDAAAGLVEPLLSAGSLQLRSWTEALRPVKESLYAPLRHAFRHSRRDTERLVAASVLADYEAGNPARLAELVVDADPQQFAVLLPALRLHGSRAAVRLSEQLGPLPWLESVLPYHEQHARRQANAAVALVHLGQAEDAWRLLRRSTTPDTRSYLIQRLAPLGVDPAVLIARLTTEEDAGARQGLILALGEYGTAQLPESRRRALLPALLRWYREDADPGVHGAIDWLLRHAAEGPLPRSLDWKQADALAAIDRELAGQAPPNERRWLVNREGMTLVVVPGPVEFWMGSPLDEPGRTPPEVRHRRRIGRSFAVASKEVTVAQWERFHKAHPEVKHYYNKEFSPAPDGPIISVTWHEAAMYCRWLSEQEGIAESQQCYPPVAQMLAAVRDQKPIVLPANFLARTGYRLPTEAEWEYACRAGTVSSRPHGEGEALLGRYAWYLNNAEDQAWPAGQKRPNDLGLFDMLGNAYEWCHETSPNYPRQPTDAVVPDDRVEGEVGAKPRGLRGGTLGVRASKLRSALRDEQPPTVRLRTLGLRVTRTVAQ